MNLGSKQLAEYLKIRNKWVWKEKRKLASDLCDLRKKKARLTQSKK